MEQPGIKLALFEVDSDMPRTVASAWHWDCVDTGVVHTPPFCRQAGGAGVGAAVGLAVGLEVGGVGLGVGAGLGLEVGLGVGLAVGLGVYCASQITHKQSYP